MLLWTQFLFSLRVCYGFTYFCLLIFNAFFLLLLKLFESKVKGLLYPLTMSAPWFLFMSLTTDSCLALACSQFLERWAGRTGVLGPGEAPRVGDHFTMYTKIESSCCTPETNIVTCESYLGNKNHTTHNQAWAYPQYPQPVALSNRLRGDGS